MKRKILITISVLMWVPLVGYLVLGGSIKKQRIGVTHHPEHPGPDVWTRSQRPQWLDDYPQGNEKTLKEMEHKFAYDLLSLRFQSITANVSLDPYEYNSFTLRGQDWRRRSPQSQEQLLRWFSYYFERKGFEEAVAAYPFSAHSGQYQFDVTKPLATYNKADGFKLIQ